MKTFSNMSDPDKMIVLSALNLYHSTIRKLGQEVSPQYLKKVLPLLSKAECLMSAIQQEFPEMSISQSFDAWPDLKKELDSL